MQTHIIENGVVVNTIVANVDEARAAYPDAVCFDGSVGAIGWALVDGALVAPVVVVDQNAPILSTIATLEATVTPRRIREALTTAPGKTWLVAVDSQIAALRGSLVK